MSDQHEHQSDDEQHDTEGHLYIPKDERAGGAPDTDGHGRRYPGEDDIIDTDGHKRYRSRLDDADDGDMVGDAEGHGRFRPQADDTIDDTDGHKRYRRLDDVDEDDMVGDAEGHVAPAPSDADNEPRAVRGRDGKGHR